MIPVAALLHLADHAVEERLGRERAKKLVVALTRLVDATDDGVDHMQPSARTDALVSDAETGMQSLCGGVLQRPRYPVVPSATTRPPRARARPMASTVARGRS